MTKHADSHEAPERERASSFCLRNWLLLRHQGPASIGEESERNVYKAPAKPPRKHSLPLYLATTSIYLRIK